MTTTSLLQPGFSLGPPLRSGLFAHCCAVILTRVSYRAIWFFAFIAIFVNVSTLRSDGAEPGLAGSYNRNNRHFRPRLVNRTMGTETLTTSSVWSAFMAVVACYNAQPSVCGTLGAKSNPDVTRE